MKDAENDSKTKQHGFFSSYEFLKALEDVAKAQVTEKQQAAIADFNSSGLSVEEFNSRHYRDDGEMFPSIEGDQMKIKSVILMPEGWAVRQQIRPEKVLKLYQENLSLQDICKSLNRSEKWIKKSLSQFGIRYDKVGARLNPSDIPFGWAEVKGKLVVNDAEQWILEKVEQDLTQGKSTAEISRSLNNLKIQPRIGRKWIDTMIGKTVATNKRLKSTLLIDSHKL